MNGSPTAICPMAHTFHYASSRIMQVQGVRKEPRPERRGSKTKSREHLSKRQPRNEPRQSRNENQHGEKKSQRMASGRGPVPQPHTRILQAKAQANDAPQAQVVGTIGDLRHALGMLGTTCNLPQAEVGAHGSEYDWPQSREFAMSTVSCRYCCHPQSRIEESALSACADNA